MIKSVKNGKSIRKIISDWGRSKSVSVSLPKHYIHKDLVEFSNQIGPVSLLLDVGCGKFPPYQSLFDHDHYFGIDFFEDSDIRADAQALPFLSGIANAVLLTEVLEHIPFPQNTLYEVYRVLQSGGYLVITVPLIWGVHDYVDYQRWTESGLSLLLNKTGFEILEINKRGSVFSTIGCLLTQIPMQLFGDMGQQSNWLITFFYTLFWSDSNPYTLDSIPFRQV